VEDACLSSKGESRDDVLAVGPRQPSRLPLRCFRCSGMRPQPSASLAPADRLAEMQMLKIPTPPLFSCAALSA
jgi:hypothetical protein